MYRVQGALTSVFVAQSSYICTYDLYSPVNNVLDASISITRASGRGLGPGYREFYGPCEMHRANRQVPFHKSPRGRFQGSYCGGGGVEERGITELNGPAQAAQVHKGT
jgi:hypothetical protein